jgi:cysteinyl-tRNA synthetase
MSNIDRHWQEPWCCKGKDDAVAASAAQPLMLQNSLVDKKVPFIPAAGPNSKQVTWYSCGPTVYDSAHMGHARNYLSIDIVRRVMEDYFGYSILFVMNVTDVEDKIILRARRNYLLKAYKDKAPSPETVRTDAAAALQIATDKQQEKLQAAHSALSQADAELSSAQGNPNQTASITRKRDDLLSAAAEQELLFKKAVDAQAALDAAPPSASLDALFSIASDALAESLDTQLGATVTDPAIFRAHAARYEAEFLEDMSILGCRPPSVLTRVTEYISEIIEYVGKIYNSGLAYELCGSVYFDTGAFRKAGHVYGKLNPWSVGNTALAGEDDVGGGDGDNNGDQQGEQQKKTTKRNPSDFALWKAQKPGEPSWDSPWGSGRPGWHIECSAMASSIVGAKLDIHTGGEDLRFPHHDNELAQAEAYYHNEGCCQWVNYFLHSGHLGIEGLKMSKSLKNFVTIRQALETFSPRQLRLMFLLQPWEKKMTYGEAAKDEMKAREAQLRNFFGNVEAASRGRPGDRAQKWEAEERVLFSELAATQGKVHTALLDNINTRGAMDALADVIKATNVYLSKRQGGGSQHQANGSTPSLPPPQAWLLKSVSGYVSRILSSFGLTPTPTDSPGFGDTTTGGGSGTDGSDERAVALLDAFGNFRQEVRKLSLAKSTPSEILKACDTVRDDVMVNLGVRLEDLPDGTSIWKKDDPAVLKAEAAERAAAASAAKVKKIKNALESRKRELEKFEKLAAMPLPRVVLADKYSKFDPETGDPVADKDGNALEGKALDKAKKDMEKAKKVRAPLEKKIAETGGEGFMDALREEVQRLAAEVAALEI